MFPKYIEEVLYYLISKDDIINYIAGTVPNNVNTEIVVGDLRFLAFTQSYDTAYGVQTYVKVWEPSTDSTILECQVDSSVYFVADDRILWLYLWVKRNESN